MANYNGFIPPDTQLLSGDYTTSPSGTYYGITGGGFFWIVPGSNPAVAGCCTSGYAPLQTVSDANLGGWFSHMQTDGNFVLYTSASGTNSGQVIPIAATNSQQATPASSYFAQIGDDGSLKIIPGSGPNNIIGSSIYSVSNPNGAVTGISLSDVTYNFNDAKFTSVTGIAGGYVDLANTTDLPQQGIGQLNLTYSQSYSLSFSVADAVGESISATTTISLPGLAKEGLTIGISNQTTVTHGHSDTTTSAVQWAAGFRPTVPPLSTLRVELNGVNASYEVPFDWVGVATYESGVTANVIGKGTFKGSSEGNFQASVYCLISVLPSHCDPGASFLTPLEFSAVPEPASMLLLLGAMALGVATRNRRRFFTRVCETIPVR